MHQGLTQQHHHQWFSPGDATDGVLQESRQGTLFGVEASLAFLDRHLTIEGRCTLSAELLPCKRSLLLYGREGSGKTALLHAGTGEGGALKTHQRYRYLSSNVFARVRDFRLQHWNMDSFVSWTKECRADMREMQLEPLPNHMEAPASLLIILGNLHKFNYVRGGDPLNALLHLLSAVRLFPDEGRVRILMLCDESPGQFPQDLLGLVDAMHFVAPPATDARLAMLLGWTHAFAELSLTCSRLSALVWDLDLESLADNPSHIMNTLAVASHGCTPREIRAFMRRSFEGVCSPTANGNTVYCAAWLESLLHTVDGNVKCIIAGNPSSLNEKLLAYAGLATEDTLIGARTCFVRQVPDMAPAAPDKPPRRVPVAQPPSVQEALAARLTAQQAQLDKAARRDKDKRRRPNDDDDDRE
jgi:hypothetical protein